MDVAQLVMLFAGDQEVEHSTPTFGSGTSSKVAHLARFEREIE